MFVIYNLQFRNNSVHPLFLFSQYKVFENGTEERTSRFYVRLRLINSERWIYEGINYQQSMKGFGFLKLINSALKDCECFLYVTLSHYPSHSSGCKYPSVWKFDYYQKNQNVAKFPESIRDLDQHHFPISRTFIEIYPGGAGMRMSQYKYVIKEETGLENKEIQLKYGEEEGISTRCLPLWTVDVNKVFV